MDLALYILAVYNAVCSKKMYAEEVGKSDEGRS